MGRNEVEGGTPARERLRLISDSQIRVTNAVFWAFWGSLVGLSLLPDWRLDSLQSVGSWAVYSFGGALLWAVASPVLIRASRPVHTARLEKRKRSLVVTLAGLTGAVAIAGGVVGATEWLGELPPRLTPHDLFVRRLPLDVTAAFFVLVFGRARAYLDHVHQRELEQIELTALLSQSRLNAIRAQLNPHFLFNTLNAISEIAESDPGRVPDMLSALSELLRRLVTDATHASVRLDEEMELLGKYLELLELRYDEFLRTEVDVGPDVADLIVPTMILQPLVENAVKHGTARSIEPGWIRISAARDASDLVLRVADSGAGRAGCGRERDGGWGLRHTVERLQHMYGGAASFRLYRNGSTGMIAEVRIPLRAAEEPLASRLDAIDSPGG